MKLLPPGLAAPECIYQDQPVSKPVFPECPRTNYGYQSSSAALDSNLIFVRISAPPRQVWPSEPSCKRLRSPQSSERTCPDEVASEFDVWVHSLYPTNQ